LPDLIQSTSEGLYCPVGDFHIDPWRPVPRAIITHAHGDHAHRGCGRYLTSTQGRHVLQTRMGASAVVDTVNYGESFTLNGVRISLHPAGHVLGSAQIRVDYRGDIWTVSGDYKVTPDQTCTPFEPVRCHTFITECTFGLPIYRWQPQQVTFAELNRWWEGNRDIGRVSVVFAYALGKAQRVIAGLDPSIGPILCHGAVERVNQDYRQSGIPLPPTNYAGRYERTKDWEGAIVVAPPSSNGTVWMRKFGDPSRALVSGWMQIRGTRRRRAVDRGFVLSDHADWPGLLSAIHATEAQRILATHGRTGPMVRWLQESGLDTAPLQTQFVGERDDADVDDAEEGAAIDSEEEAVINGENVGEPEGERLS